MIGKKIFKHLKNEKGFTLLEVIIIALIIGLVGAAVLPSLIKADGSGSDIDRTAKMILAELSLAQQTAVSTGNTCRVEFYRNGKSLRLFLPVESRRVWLPEGIEIVYNNFPLTDNNAYHRLSFNRNGAPNRAGTIGFGDSYGNRLYIIVNLATGRMRISETMPDD